MATLYSKIRIALRTFAFGLVAVYLADGLSDYRNRIHVDLPVAESGEVLNVVAVDHAPQIRKVGICGRSDEEERQRQPTALETQAAILDGRNILDYDIGGFTGCFFPTDRMDPRECDRSDERARRFIWNHWRQRKRGYITHRAAFICSGATQHIFIEPSGNSEMQIVWKWEDNYGQCVTKGKVSKSTVIKSVHLRRAKKNDHVSPARSDYLEFVDDDGKIHEW